MAATDDVLSNDVVIRDSYNAKNGTADTGGIIGINHTQGTTLLERVWNEADISATFRYSGGIIGYGRDCGSIIMNQVYNFGNILGDETEIGGMIGSAKTNMDAAITFNDCVNYGNVSNGESDEIGGFIGASFPAGGKNDIIFNNCANFGTIAGTNRVGGFIGDSDQYRGQVEGRIVFNHSYNYGRVTGDEGEKSVADFIGYMYFGNQQPNDNLPYFTHSGTIGDKVVGEIEADAGDVSLGNFDVQTGLTAAPDPTAYANERFLSWQDLTTVDYKGKLGTETGSYPDGGYTWKLYETGLKDSKGNRLFHKPELTAFQTKVSLQKGSVKFYEPDVSGARYDVTLPDGQQIKGVDWQRVLALQDQFTRVQYRGDGTQQVAYTASDREAGGSVLGHIYGYYNSSQQGLNIFVTPVLPNREVSRNDYLYSDEHDTGDGEQHWYMHMPPRVYIRDAGVQTGDKPKKSGSHI